MSRDVSGIQEQRPDNVAPRSLHQKPPCPSAAAPAVNLVLRAVRQQSQFSPLRGIGVDNQNRRTHCENMKNLTVSLDDETYRRARMIAAERDTSVSALVKGFLTRLTAGETEFERLKQLEEETRAKITNFSASENLQRDELYDRRF
jgi:hypothetical protein